MVYFWLSIVEDPVEEARFHYLVVDLFADACHWQVRTVACAQGIIYVLASIAWLFIGCLYWTPVPSAFDCGATSRFASGNATLFSLFFVG